MHLGRIATQGRARAIWGTASQSTTTLQHCFRHLGVSAMAAGKGACQGGLTVQPSEYPPIRRDETVVEDLHGTQVADPYRWLEDQDSEETRQFVEAQNALTQKVLAQCDSRDKFKQLFTNLFNYPKLGSPHKHGDRYYYFYNSGLQQQYVLLTQPSVDAEASVFLDPNTLSEDGTIALKDHAFSEDGKLMAYSLSSGGSDWSYIKVLGVDPSGSPAPLDDKLDFVKFSSMAWTHDHQGFFYNRYPDPKSVADLGTETDINTDQMLCYHVLGTPQEQDVVVYAIPDHPTWMCSAEVTDDGRYLLLYVSEGCLPANRIYYVDLSSIPKDAATQALDLRPYDFKAGSQQLPIVKLVDDFEASYRYVANEGETFFFMTNLAAPRYRINKAQLPSPGPPSTWPEVLAQHPKDLLDSAVALKGDRMVVSYLRDVAAVLQLRRLASGELLRELPLPGLGSVGGFSGDRKGTEFFFSYTSFVEPGSTYRVDVADAEPEPTLFRRTKLSVEHNPEDYVTKQVFVTSKDGTQVPMFVTHRKGLALDGTAPTLLYGYGGFNISLEPTFSASRLAFMRGYDGIFAQANLRGGGEYGIEWRNAGSKENKQNVFDDFQACAEHLIKERYCSPSTLTIQGGSNGGLLVAACMNQRPDLYCCGLAQVGVMDVLRFHKFTIGHAWTTDYGDPDTPEAFAYIYPYSPLHNVRNPEGGQGQYPAVMLATGDHDDRVVPLHSFKLIAELQHTLAAASPETSAQRNPLLIRVEVRAGHGAGKPTAKIIQETSDLFAYAARCMGAAWKGGEDGGSDNAQGARL